MELRGPSAKYLVRSVFKYTEVGQIPEDWQVVALSALSSKITDGTHDTPTPVRLGRPYLTAIHVKENAVDYESCLYLSEEDHKVIFARCNPTRGDVLIVNIGAGVATTAVVNVNFEFSLKNVALLKPDTRKSDGGFVNYALVTRKSSIVHALSSGGAQPFLSLTQIGEIKIAVPPTKEEQQAIATALSDADALIESLEQLLAKKRQIKQGAMQELLTGKRRLPGFEGEWKRAAIGALCRMKSGESITAESINEYSDFPCFGGNGLRGYTQRFNHDGMFALVGRQGALCGNIVVASGRFFASEHAIVVTPSANANIHWLARILDRMNLNQYSESSAQPGLSVSKLLILECLAPGFDEQAAIATILSDMDADITTLEAKLAKARAIKQGMMQELLTGRIRLI